MVKGSATIYQWLTRFEIFDAQGLEECWACKDIFLIVVKDVLLKALCK